jgi:hypothetical protein
MAMGNVKRLVHDRGFGFVTADDGRDIFSTAPESRAPPSDLCGRGNGSPLTSNRVRKGHGPCMCRLPTRFHRANGRMPISSGAGSGLATPCR